jgi:biopolymer transport protein ExbB/TolQ
MGLRAQIDANTLIVDDLNTTLSPTDRSTRQKINKEVLGHKASPNKFKKIEIISHHIISQWNKNRPQKHKKPQKIFKHMETEQHTVKKPVGD